MGYLDQRPTLQGSGNMQKRRWEDPGDSMAITLRNSPQKLWLPTHDPNKIKQTSVNPPNRQHYLDSVGYKKHKGHEIRERDILEFPGGEGGGNGDGNDQESCSHIWNYQRINEVYSINKNKMVGKRAAMEVTNNWPPRLLWSVNGFCSHHSY